MASEYTVIDRTQLTGGRLQIKVRLADGRLVSVVMRDPQFTDDELTAAIKAHVASGYVTRGPVRR